jgi:diacylglycerol kinase family enzyme
MAMGLFYQEMCPFPGFLMYNREYSPKEDSPMPRYKIIVNPVSGRGMAGKSIPLIENYLHGHGLDFDLILTERPWHAADLAEQAAKDGYDVVVAASGDGTANEVLNGLMRARAQGADKTAMSILTVGTGNDFAYGMRVPLGLEAGCRALAEDYRRRVDVGLLKGGDYPDGRYFGNGVGIGFDAETGFVAAKIRWMTGLLLYLIAAIETIFIYFKAPKVRIVYDGIILEQASLMVSIMNGIRMGGGFYFAPKGDPCDGHFDLCIAETAGKLRVFQLGAGIADCLTIAMNRQSPLQRADGHFAGLPGLDFRLGGLRAFHEVRDELKNAHLTGRLGNA